MASEKEPAIVPAADNETQETRSNPSDHAQVHSSAASTPDTSDKEETTSPRWRTFHIILDRLSWMPPWCRFDPKAPPAFGLPLNLLFAFAGCFTVANLYYNHPILNILAHDFGVSNYEVSKVPTLCQSGYVIGLAFLCPLGDLVKRRPYTLALIFVTATLWIGLCTTRNFIVFETLSFLTAITTVTPQLMLPLVGDLAPAHKRATALSVVISGNLMGIMVARILSGIVTDYTSWRNVYWVALGLQYLIFALLWLFMPDYPSTNPHGLSYIASLRTIIGFCWKHPVLVWAGIISYLNSACFTSYWTTLTFLLAGPPYSYSSLYIGLFALIGIFAMVLGPVYARLLIEPFVPLFPIVLAELFNLTGLCIGTYIGKHSIAGPIIMALTIDAGMQISQIANRSQIYALEPHARNRINTAFMVFTFLGQVTGTAAGNRLYADGGWVASGSLSVAFVAFALCLCGSRGPYEKGWFGWTGGWSIRKRTANSSDGFTVEQPSGLAATRQDPEKETART